MAYSHIDQGAESYKRVYERFYTTFLTKFNSLPMNSLWSLWIKDINIEYIQQIIDQYENWSDFSYSTLLNDVWGEIESSQNLNGLLLAQGVKTLGETIEVERIGIKNTGFIPGLVNNGRTGFPLLKVEFLENNVSFVDYILRPWIVAVSHKSLKDADLKTDITVTFYSKMGAGVDLAERKSIRYEGCCPVGLDELESNYTGADMLKLRGVHFVFNKYTILPARKALIDMFSGSNADPSAKLIKEVKRDDAIKNWIEDNDIYINKGVGIGYPPMDAKTGYSYEMEAISPDHRSTGAEAPSYVPKIITLDDVTITGVTPPTYIPKGSDANREGYLNRLITDAGQFASDLVSGTVKGVISNLTTTVTNKIDQVIHQTKSDIQMVANDIVNKSGDSLGRLIHEAGSEGSIQNRLTSVVLKTVNPNDTPMHPTPTITVDNGKPTSVDINKITDPNDVRHFEINHQDVIKSVDSKDVRHNEINHQDVIKLVDPNDYITTKTPIVYTIVQTDQNDVRKTNESVNFANVLTNQNDVRKTNESVNFVNQPTDQNDYITKNTVINYENKTTDQNDFITKNTVIAYVKKETDSNDTVKPSDISYIVKSINPSDHK